MVIAVTVVGAQRAHRDEHLRGHQRRVGQLDVAAHRGGAAHRGVLADAARQDLLNPEPCEADRSLRGECIGALGGDQLPQPHQAARAGVDRGRLGLGAGVGRSGILGSRDIHGAARNLRTLTLCRARILDNRRSTLAGIVGPDVHHCRLDLTLGANRWGILRSRDIRGAARNLRTLTLRRARILDNRRSTLAGIVGPDVHHCRLDLTLGANRWGILRDRKIRGAARIPRTRLRCRDRVLGGPGDRIGALAAGLGLGLNGLRLGDGACRALELRHSRSQIDGRGLLTPQGPPQDRGDDREHDRQHCPCDDLGAPAHVVLFSAAVLPGSRPQPEAIPIYRLSSGSTKLAEFSRRPACWGSSSRWPRSRGC